MGLAVGNDGTLYAADGMSFVVISRDGKQSRSGMLLDEGFPGFVRGIAAAPGGALYVTNSAGTVSSYHPGTRASQTLTTGLQEALGLACALRWFGDCGRSGCRKSREGQHAKVMFPLLHKG